MTYGYRRKDFLPPWDKKAWIAAALFFLLALALAHGAFSGLLLLRYVAFGVAASLAVRAFFWDTAPVRRWRKIR